MAHPSTDGAGARAGAHARAAGAARAAGVLAVWMGSTQEMFRGLEGTPAGA